MATRTTVINDPVGIHARPAAQFTQPHRLRLHRHHRQGRRQPGSGRLHPVHHGPGHQAGRSVVIDVQGADDETVADNLLNILVNAE